MDFRVEQPIRLSSKLHQGSDFIESASLSVNASPKTLHFIHGTDTAAPEQEDDDIVPILRIGEWTVDYASGHQEEIPIIYGTNVLSWWVLDKHLSSPSLKSTEPAWMCQHPVAREWRRGFSLALCQYSWENPRPDDPIVRMTVTSSKDVTPAYLLIALTLEL